MRRTIIRIKRGLGGPYITIEDTNREILAVTEPYASNSNARRSATNLRRRFLRAKIVDDLDHPEFN